MITPEDNFRLAYMVEALEEIRMQNWLTEEEIEKLNIAHDNIKSICRVPVDENQTV